MSGYFLTEGSSSGSGYPNRFQFLNQWFENTFGRIVGDGFGVRNWFGPCEEGDWTETYELKDYWLLALLTFGSAMIATYLTTINNITLALISLGFPVAIYAVYGLNHLNKKLILEWIEPKYIKEQLKLPILVVCSWVILSIVLHALFPQQIFTTTTSTILDKVLEFYIPLINTPVVETLAFVIFTASFAVYLGIIPSLSLNSILIGIFHYVIFKGEFINILLSIILRFFLLAIVLKYKNSFPAIFGHSLANTLAIIINAI